MARWIDTTGKTPTLKVGAAATGILGTILVGLQSGFISILTGFGGGYSSTLDGVNEFVSGGVIPSLVDLVVDVGRAAALTNGEWLSTFGALGIVVGFVEGFGIILVVIWTVRTVVSTLLGGL